MSAASAVLCAAAAPSRSEPDGATLRRVLGHFATGVTVISARAPDNHLIGITVNSFNALSLAPPLVIWSLSEKSPNCDLFKRGALFVVNVLNEGQGGLAYHFATPQPDKYKGIPHRLNQYGIPILDGVLAHLQCRVEQALQLGDHTLLVSAVEDCDHADKDAPLLFFKSKFGKWLES